MSAPKPVMLVVLDGWGWREEVADNAVRQAKTPTFEALWGNGPHAFLHTSGHDVGLPDGQMGNSEVGHLNLGAGRVVMQDLPRIDATVVDGSIARIPALVEFIGKLKANGGTCHLVGLLSAGGVHSHQKHAAARAKVVAAAGVPVAIHCLTDGRDTAPQAAPEFMRAFQADLGATPGVRIATVIGRYFAMDRDNRWERVSQAYNAMVLGEGEKAADPQAAIAAAHAAGKTDEFIPACAIDGYAGMADGDGVLCFNFRADRVREILGALLDPAFSGFERKKVVKFAAAAGMTQYSTFLDGFMATLFPPQSMADKLGEVVSRAGLKQLRMAETEKYPHVTYFLNGGEEAVLPGEDRIMVPSPKVATYDLQPEMSAPELAQKAVDAIDGGTYDLIVLNFANPDMVGHTGVLAAAIKAVETVDAGLGRIVDAVRRQGGAMLITGPEGAKAVGIGDGRLADVAPTLLALMGLPQPAAMTGKSLLRGG